MKLRPQLYPTKNTIAFIAMASLHVDVIAPSVTGICESNTSYSDDNRAALAGIVAHTFEILMKESMLLRGGVCDDKFLSVGLDGRTTTVSSIALAQCLLELENQRAECHLLSIKLRDTTDMLGLLRKQIVCDVRGIFGDVQTEIDAEESTPAILHKIRTMLDNLTL
jgi:hypothetical protein